MSGVMIRWGLRGLVVLAVIGLVIMTARGAGLRWDPFGWEQRRAAVREAALERAVMDGRARALEARAERTQADRRFAAQAQVVAADAVVTQLDHELGKESHAPLDDRRLERLRDVDRQLCQLAPDLGGCASAP